MDPPQGRGRGDTGALLRERRHPADPDRERPQTGRHPRRARSVVPHVHRRVFREPAREIAPPATTIARLDAMPPREEPTITVACGRQKARIAMIAGPVGRSRGCAADGAGLLQEVIMAAKHLRFGVLLALAVAMFGPTPARAWTEFLSMEALPENSGWTPIFDAG